MPILLCSDQSETTVNGQTALHQGNAGQVSHLLGATIQFLTEMYIVEVTAPAITRVRQPDLYDVPLLTFGSS